MIVFLENREILGNGGKLSIFPFGFYGWDRFPSDLDAGAALGAHFSLKIHFLLTFSVVAGPGLKN